MSDLLYEYEIMQNVGMSAEALFVYSGAFENVSRGTDRALTLWHLVTVLPLVFHAVSRRAISKRQTRSGLRSILTRDPENDIAQNEPIFNLNNRLKAMYPRTIRSFNCAIAWGLLEIHDGLIFTKHGRRVPVFSGEARQIIDAAKKLGTWAGQLTAFEYFIVLGVRLGE
jgi:hypothetical protein